MTFALSTNERELLLEAESKFRLWCCTERQFASVAVERYPPLPEPRRGSPGNHIGHVWVRIAAQQWLEVLEKEPGAKDSRFSAAVIEFAQTREHLPIVGVDLIKVGIKLWRNVGYPATRHKNYLS